MDWSIFKNQQNSLSVIIWLMIGLVMVYLQIVIGGITRLTGSGLSITEWDIVYGSIPPLTENSWLEEFEKYKLTPQYKKLNVGMELGSIFTAGSFKFIYFWEFLHRLWARTMGFVFLFPFIFFYFKGLIPKGLFFRLVRVIFLAALAATFGWIMVASGLVNRPWVNAYKLSIHLCIGISVFIALWWAFLKYIYNNYNIKRLDRPGYLYALLALVVIQIFLGGVMSGTKASLFINTWPDLNGEFLPDMIIELENWSSYNFNNYEKNGFVVTLVQFMHRSTAYLILLWSCYIFYSNRMWKSGLKGHYSFNWFLFFLMSQVVIGILTLINSIGLVPIFLGVLHQGVAVLLLAAFFSHMLFVTYSPTLDELNSNI